MVGMGGAPVDTVHTEKFMLILAVESHEVVVNHAFLRSIVLEQ